MAVVVPAVPPTPMADILTVRKDGSTLIGSTLKPEPNWELDICTRYFKLAENNSGLSPAFVFGSPRSTWSLGIL